MKSDSIDEVEVTASFETSPASANCSDDDLSFSSPHNLKELAGLLNTLTDERIQRLPSEVLDVCEVFARHYPSSFDIRGFALHVLCGAPQGVSPNGRSLWIEFDGRCNWQCKFCYNEYRGEVPPRGAPVDQLLEVARNLVEVSAVGAVCVAGGEPLLRTDLEELVAGLKELSVDVAIATNGHNLSVERVSSLRSAGCDLFQVAVHACRPKTHDDLTGVSGSWVRSMQGLLNCLDQGTPVVPVFVATSHNVHEFPLAVEMFGAMGLPKAVFNRFVPAGYGARRAAELDISNAEVLHYLTFSDVIATQYGIDIRMGVPANIDVGGLLSVEDTSCSVRSVNGAQLVVGLDGALRQCAADYSGTKKSYSPDPVGEPCVRRTEWTAVALRQRGDLG